jgi:penicillin V acylase-like amidase (Ntn superfamily)
VREGESSENYHLNFTQYSVVGDIKDKRWYWWTEHNRRMRMVDLNALNFEGKKIRVTPLDEVRIEDIKNRTKDLNSQ